VRRAIAIGVVAAAIGCGGDLGGTGGASSAAGGASASAGGGASSAGGASGGGASSSGGGPASGGSSPAGGAGGATSSGGAPCALVPSGPVVATADGQVIEGLHVVSKAGPAITIAGHAHVVVRNVWIEHEGGPGVSVSSSDDVVIESVAIDHTGAPPSGPNPSADAVSVACEGSARLAITGARLTRGSSGVYLLGCADAALRSLEGHDVRGPFPRGQLVQWDKSDGGLLEDFSIENPAATAWPEDCVNVYQSHGVTIRRGLVDGDTSPSGVGVIFDGGDADGTVEDVDAVRMGNGCFSDYAGADGVVFRRVRCRDNVCGDQGRGAPSSNGLMFCGHPGYSNIRLEQASWFHACNPGNVLWPAESFAVKELAELDFASRAPIRVPLCWE
jgi:hypothetical protein